MAAQRGVYDTTIHTCAHCGKRCFWGTVLDGFVVNTVKSQDGAIMSEVVWFDVHSQCKEKYGELTEDQRLEFLRTRKAVSPSKQPANVEQIPEITKTCSHSFVMPSGCSTQYCPCKICSDCHKTVWPKGDAYYTQEQLLGRE